MKTLAALLALVSVPTFAADNYACTSTNSSDRVQAVTIEVGQNGPVDYMKIFLGGNVISGIPTKLTTEDKATTYSLVISRVSYVMNIANTGAASIWVPANGNAMACTKN